jgi:hypothetical protein
METVRIVVPLYKAFLDDIERMSLCRSLDVMKSHSFSIICPHNLDLASIEPMFDGVDYDVRRFDPEFFRGIKGYNRLMLSSDFYSAFIDYNHILICQTDVFVFSDQLLFWCEKDYDYIGAPWMASPQHPLKKFFYGIENFFRRKKKSQHHFFKVGNGGFSLRNVEVMLRIVSELKDEIVYFSEHWDERKYHQEDVFISVYAPSQIPNIKIPDYKEAVAFAMDRKPWLAYKLNNNKLPFACHGFNKSKVSKFWAPIIGGILQTRSCQ